MDTLAPHSTSSHTLAQTETTMTAGTEPTLLGEGMQISPGELPPDPSLHREKIFSLPASSFDYRPTLRSRRKRLSQMTIASDATSVKTTASIPRIMLYTEREGAVSVDSLGELGWTEEDIDGTSTSGSVGGESDSVVPSSYHGSSGHPSPSPPPVAPPAMERAKTDDPRVESSPHLGNPVYELTHGVSGTFWLDVCGPTVEDMFLLSRIFKIHPLTAEDVLADAEETRDKCDIYPHYAFLVYSTFQQLVPPASEPEAISIPIPVPVFILLFPGGVVSLHAEPTSQAGRVLRRIERLHGLVKPTPEWISYALLDAITDKYEPLLADAVALVSRIDDMLSLAGEQEARGVGRGGALLRKIAGARRILTHLSRLLSGKPDVLRALVKRSSGAGDIRLYLGDVQDHAVTMSTKVVGAEATLNRLHAAHLAFVNVGLATASARTGETLARLTFLAQLLLPYVLVGGLFGMNVWVPGKFDDEFRWWYVIVLSVSVIVLFSVAWARYHRLV